jgi:hypothetical protein
MVSVSAEKHIFTKGVIASFVGNILFASILGGGLYLGFKKSWLKIKE